MISTINFPGFYCSHYDAEFDHTLERDCQYFAEDWGVDADTVADVAFSHTEYAEAQLAIAKCHVNTWLEKFTDETDIDVFTDGSFNGMTSPKFYNFETDRVFADIPEAAVKAAYAFAEADGFKLLTSLIKERFTSRDGFMSNYSNDINEWVAKPVDEWDLNEVQTLLESVLSHYVDLSDFNEDVVMETLDYTSGNGFYDVTDWDTVERKVNPNPAL